MVDHLLVFMGGGKVKDFVGKFSEYRSYIKDYEASLKAAQKAEETPGWEVLRDRTYGKTRICIWRRVK